MQMASGPRHGKTLQDKYLSVILLAAFMLCSLFSSAQSVPSPPFLKPNNSYGTIQNRGENDSTQYFPTGCGVPTDSTFLYSMQNNGKGEKPKMGAQYYDSCGHHEYVWDPSLKAWHIVDSSGGSGGGFTTSDTGYTKILASPSLVQKTIDSMKAVNDARYKLKSDSLANSSPGYVTQASRQKLSDSLQALVALKLSRGDTVGNAHVATNGHLNKVADSLAALITSAGYGPTDTLKGATLPTQRALVDSINVGGTVTATGFSPFGKKWVFMGHSYVFGANASTTAKRWTSQFCRLVGCTEVNLGVSGSTLMLQQPKDYQGALSMNERWADIPNYDPSYDGIIIDIGLNDAGQTAAAYTLAHYSAAGDSLFNQIHITKGWPLNKICIMGVEWIGSAGLTFYGTVTGNTAPTVARMIQFDSVNYDLARRWKINWVPEYNQILTHDPTLISGTGSVHPTDSGYLYIAQNVIQKLGLTTIGTAPTTTDSSTFVTTTHLQTYTNTAIAALSPQLIQFTVGDNGAKTPANGAATYVDSLLIGALSISVSQQGMTMPVGRARNAVYATFNDTTGTVTIHNGAFTDSAYYEIVGFYINKIPPTTPDDSNFIAAVIANGGTLTSNQQGYITTFFNSLKSGGLWDKILASHMLFLGSANASKFNIKNSLNTDAAFRITWHGTGTFASNGWASDGSTGYGDLHFNPSVAAGQDALGFGAYVRGGSTGSTIYFIGNYDGSSITNQIGVDVSSGMVAGVNSALAGIAAQTVSAPTRLIYGNRSSSGFVSYYRDGTNVAVKAQTSNTPFNGNLYLGCFNFNGTPSFFFGNTITMDFITDGSLSDADEAALNTIVNTFLTSWGINI